MDRLASIIVTAIAVSLLSGFGANTPSHEPYRPSPCPTVLDQTLTWFEALGKDDGTYLCDIKLTSGGLPEVSVAFGPGHDNPTGAISPLPASLRNGKLEWSAPTNWRGTSSRTVILRAAPNQLNGPWWLVTISITFRTTAEFANGERFVRSLVFPDPSSNYRLERP